MAYYDKNVTHVSVPNVKHQIKQMCMCVHTDYMCVLLTK